MADKVEKTMQGMVEELDDLRRKRIFSETELKEIVRRRRDFEYGLQATPCMAQRYLGYVRYEVAVECLRARRSKKLGWRTKTKSDFAGIRRLHLIFDRATKRFKGNTKMWYQYIDFCLRSGSFKIFSSVLLRALKYHPKEVHIWILAADHELKKNHVKASRALLMRGLRCVPKSPKLWSEILRLEVQIAGRLWALRNTSEEATLSPWAPARVVLKRALARLGNRPLALATFLDVAMQCIRQCLKAVKSEGELDELGEGVEDLASDFRMGLAEQRPGVSKAEAAWADAAPEVAASVWQLWCDWERLVQGAGWGAVAEAAAEVAPPIALRRLASELSKAARADGADAGSAADALVGLAKASRSSVDAETALAVLDAIESCTGEDSDVPGAAKDAMSAAARGLLRRATAELRGSARLQLLAWKEKGSPGGASGLAQIIADAEAMQVDEATNLRLLMGTRAASQTGASASAPASKLSAVEKLLRGLAASAPARPLLEAHLSEALVVGGSDAFRSACDEVRSLASRLWDLPQRRLEVLEAVLDVEMRCCTSACLARGPAEPAQAAKRMSGLFEDILSSMKGADPNQDEWWIRYLEFAQRCSRWGLASGKDSAGGSGVPSTTEIHWRAMKAVSSQAQYQERVHGLV